MYKIVFRIKLNRNSVGDHVLESPEKNSNTWWQEDIDWNSLTYKLPYRFHVFFLSVSRKRLRLFPDVIT